MWSPKLLRFIYPSTSSHFSPIYLQTKLFTNLPLTYNTEKDPGPYFFSPKVQRLLKHLARPDNSKIFRKRNNKGDSRLETPEYKFLTDKQLAEEWEKVKEKAEKLLQMPPVVKVYEHVDNIISKDPAIQGHSGSQFIFTDISVGIKNKDRICVVREPDGTLRHADYGMSKKMNQIYFPMEGRTIREPAVLTDEILFKKVLDRKEFEFLLDKACIQYDPDELQFQSLCAKVYQCCDENGDYEILRSTRHFGPMVFYFAWNNIIDGLLLELLTNGVIKESVSLISLQRIIHPEMAESDETPVIVDEILKEKPSDSARISESEINLHEKCIACVENYIMKNSTKKSQQELALQGLREFFKKKIDVEYGIRRAHGTN